MKHILIIIVCLPIIVFGQKAIQFPNIDLIGFNDFPSFYVRENNNIYEIKYDIECAKNKNRKDTFCQFVFEKSMISKLNVLPSDLLNVKDIKSYSESSFKRLIENINLVGKNDEGLVFSNFNCEYFSLKYYNDKGVERVEYFKKYLVTVAPQKIVCLLVLEDEVIGYLFPLKDKLTLYLANNQEVKWRQAETVRNSLSTYDEFAFPIDKIKIVRTRDGKIILKDIYNSRLLPSYSDSIFYNSYFIVQKNGEYFTLFNLKMKKIASRIRNIKLMGPVASILIKNKIKDIDFLGIEVKMDIAPIRYCGTVKNYSFSIEFDSTKQKQTIKFLRGGSADPFSVSRKFFIDSVAARKIEFINGSSSFNYNDNFGKPNKNAPYYFILKTSGKVGLASLPSDFDKLPEDSLYALSPIWVTHYELDDKKVILQMDLPILYDSIIEKQNQILFFQNGSVGIYKTSNKVRYKSIYFKDANFARFVLPNGKRGWLDLVEKKEYFDE